LRRRANHRHIFTIERILKARAGKPAAGFFIRASRIGRQPQAQYPPQERQPPGVLARCRPNFTVLAHANVPIAVFCTKYPEIIRDRSDRHPRKSAQNRKRCRGQLPLDGKRIPEIFIPAISARRFFCPGN
jgi:hypothetical protein